MFSRRVADRAAFAAVLLVALVGAYGLYATWGSGVEASPRLKTVKTITETKTVGGKQQTTSRTETTVADRDANIWERVLGPSGLPILRVLLVPLLAFIIAGALQRTLVGEFALKVGPLEMPAITKTDVSEAVDAATSGVREEASSKSGEPTPPPSPTYTSPASYTSGDPQLDLANLRIEIEKRLRDIYDIATHSGPADSTVKAH